MKISLILILILFCNEIYTTQMDLNIWNDTIYIIGEINQTYYEIIDLLNLFNNTIIPEITTTIIYANYTLEQLNTILPVANNTILYANYTLKQANNVIEIIKLSINKILFILIYIITPILIFLSILWIIISILLIKRLYESSIPAER